MALNRKRDGLTEEFIAFHNDYCSKEVVVYRSQARRVSITVAQQKSSVRKIIHIDLDAFYASVEQRDNPALRGRPVIVGGDVESRGVVATASYEARKYGVHSAQSCRTALQLCPDAIFLRPRFDLYRAISRQIQSIYHRYTPLVEPLSLDEAYMDVTSVVGENGSATSLAREIKQAILTETDLTSSAGVSFNKFLSKLASAYRKPQGLTVVTPPQAQKFLDALPVGKFFGVGDVTEARLKSLGIITGSDLRQISLEKLQQLFGKRGSMLYHFARGEDSRPVQPERERKSIGKETTFPSDLANYEEMLPILEKLAHQVEQRLTELELAAKTITLKLRWHDFQLITRSVSSPTPVKDAQNMMSSIEPLLAQLLIENKPVRLLGVTVSHLIPAEPTNIHHGMSMLSLWDIPEAETHIELSNVHN